MTAQPVAGPDVSEHDLVLADRVVQGIGMLMRVVKRAVPATQDYGLEAATLPVLARLGAEGPQRSGEIAAAMCADPSTISRQVAALVRAGLVERRADPGDGRASQLATTAEGHRVLDAERRRRAEQLASALTDWSPEARGRFADMLDRFVTDLQKHDGGTR
ncbi:hypothetical protein GCM10009836_62360 [Pseudonocardia ailaonensis]|uniref:HTH marR-type domain-containing protein n=1 Tax=Pseudonocardia ailaonensis TaxID=367279 RepID=A0ABN2NLD6_9PSEU